MSYSYDGLHRVVQYRTHVEGREALGKRTPRLDLQQDKENENSRHGWTGNGLGDTLF